MSLKPAARAMNAYAAKREAAEAHYDAVAAAYQEGWEALMHASHAWQEGAFEGNWKLSIARAKAQSPYLIPASGTRCVCGSTNFRFQQKQNAWVCDRCLEVLL
jgi:hypothetical protein